jgi:hypothetical protein
MFASQHYRALAAEHKERAHRAITLKEKRKLQNLEQSFTTLAENEEWLSNNYHKTVHAPARLAKSTSALP